MRTNSSDGRSPQIAPPRVVILGAGFGGLNAAKALRKARAHVTVVDRRNHHLFQPLLYQVATAALSPADIAAPIRRVLRHQRNTEVVLAECKAVDLSRRVLRLDTGELPYDYLIVATGSTHSYFGHAEFETYAPGLKTIEDALEIRRRVLCAYEMAERTADPDERRMWMTFAIVGAGPTGVELAGALAEIARKTLEKDFRHIDPRQARVVLVEAGPRVLAAYPSSLSDAARRQLQTLGVEVVVGQEVSDVTEEGVRLGSAFIAARTVLWAAGVAASPLARSFGTPLDRAGRVHVTPELSVPGHDEVYVVGDLARVETDGKPVPGLAPAAMQEGRHAAKNILRTLAGAPREPFRYRDKGTLATIGRRRAVADLGRVRCSGALAWLLWLLVHIVYLVGFRNRVAVLFDWAWMYFTWDRGARLITGETLPLPAQLYMHPSAELLAETRALPAPADAVEEASLESFPASDPPAWIGMRGEPPAPPGP